MSWYNLASPPTYKYAGLILNKRQMAYFHRELRISNNEILKHYPDDQWLPISEGEFDHV